MRRRPETAPLSMLGVLAGATGVALTLAAWVAGGLFAVVRTGRWREIPLVRAPRLLVGLLEHPTAPRQVWPPAEWPGLPAGPVLLAGVAGVLVAGALLGVGVAAALGATRRPAGGERWAVSRDLAGLRVPGPTGDRVVLGSFGRRLVAAERGHSVLVAGPTQSGKTTGLAVPAVLEWRGPVLATSVKGDLLHATIAGRRLLGEVRCFDPTGVTGEAPVCWSPLGGAGTWAGARRVASSLCSVTRTTPGSMEDGGFWYANAEKLLGPLLFAAATAGASMDDVLRWLDTEEVGEVVLALELAGVGEAVRAARACFSREDRQRASIYATAETVLAAYADPAVANSARRSDLWGGELTGGGSGTLYCCAPARDQERLAPVFTALVREVLDEAFDRSVRCARALDPPLLVVLDEAANVAPLDDLDRVVATGAGHGIQLLTIWQDLAQVESRYGSRWQTVVNNHRAKLVCPGISDPLTLGHLSSLVGEEQRAEASWTVGGDGTSSRTESVTRRALAPAGVLRCLEEHTAVLVYGSLPPARLTLRGPGRVPRLSRRHRAKGVGSGSGPIPARVDRRLARFTAWSPRRS